MKLDELYALRAKLIADAGKIASRCGTDESKWTGEDKAEFNRLHDEADKVFGQIRAEKAAAERTDRQRQAEESLRESRGRVAQPAEPGAQRPGAVTFEFNGRRVALRIDRDPLLARRAEAGYVEAFNAYLGGAGVPQGAMQTDIADTGGYFAPPQFVAELVAELNNSFWFRRLCRVLPPTTAPKVTMPRRTARMSAFVWGTELATPTADTGYKVGTYNLTPHYSTGEVEVSNDLIRAASIGVEEVVRGEINFQAGELEEKAFFDGTGAGQPMGIFKADANGIPTSQDLTGDPSLFETWFDAKLNLREPYLRSDSLRWVLHRNAVRLLSKMKATTGEPLWVVSTRDGQPEMFNGVEVVLSEYAPKGTGASNTYASGDYCGIIGDFRNYDILDGLDLSVLRLEDSYYARRNMIGYVIRRKVDGCPRIGEAFVRVKKT